MQEQSKKYLPNNILADNLRFLRDVKDIKQHELAKMLNVTRENVTSYEKGVVPKLPALVELVNIFYFPVEILCKINLQLNWIFQMSYEENVNVICKSNCKSISKTEGLPLQNGGNDTFPRSENQKPGVKTGSDAGSVTKTELSLPVFEQTQLQEAATQYQTMSSTYKQEIEILKNEVASLKERLQDKEERILELKEHIQTLKNAKFPTQVSVLEHPAS